MAQSRIIDEVFVNKPDLKAKTKDAIAKDPGLEPLFNDIAGFIQELTIRDESTQVNGFEAFSSKKRKVQGLQYHDSSDAQFSNLEWPSGSFVSVKDLSFSIPQRKKFTLEIGKNKTQGLLIKHPANNDIEFSIKWELVGQVCCLPVPEKAQAQYNFCVFPLHNTWFKTSLDNNQDAEHLLWTVLDVVPKPGIQEAGLFGDPNETYKTLLLRLLNEQLKKHGKTVIEPDETEFVSQVAQALRKGQKAMHIKAFRGNKDGFLFLLSEGIAWGFKKPLAFFTYDCIESVSYTSVLQRTFNLNIVVHDPSIQQTEEVEFSMIDQADFAGIDAYVKRHQLQDSSMAEKRRARWLNINSGRSHPGSASADVDNHEGQLEKARKEADTEDEEEDENFDPGSEGDSEGSGSSTENENIEVGNQRNLVEEELGSEAELMEEMNVEAKPRNRRE